MKFGINYTVLGVLFHIRLLKDEASAALLCRCLGVKPGSTLSAWFPLGALERGTWLWEMGHWGCLFDSCSPEPRFLFLVPVCQEESGSFILSLWQGVVSKTGCQVRLSSTEALCSRRCVTVSRRLPYSSTKADRRGLKLSIRRWEDISQRDYRKVVTFSIRVRPVCLLCLFYLNRDCNIHAKLSSWEAAAFSHL